MRSKETFATPSAAARAPAAATMPPDRSVPGTWPSAPTDRAALNVTSPVPQATSSTRSPERSANAPSKAPCADASGDAHSDA